MTKSWQEAEDHCKSEQAHLASIHSQEELSFITGEKQLHFYRNQPRTSVLSQVPGLFMAIH